MDHNKEEWIDTVMSSFSGMAKAEPSPFLKTRIMARITNPAARRVSLLPRIAFAGSLLFLGFSLSVLLFPSGETGPAGESAYNELMSELNSTTNGY